MIIARHSVSLVSGLSMKKLSSNLPQPSGVPMVMIHPLSILKEVQYLQNKHSTI